MIELWEYARDMIFTVSEGGGIDLDCTSGHSLFPLAEWDLCNGRHKNMESGLALWTFNRLVKLYSKV